MMKEKSKPTSGEYAEPVNEGDRGDFSSRAAEGPSPRGRYTDARFKKTPSIHAHFYEKNEKNTRYGGEDEKSYGGGHGHFPHTGGVDEKNDHSAS
jgi:hypothetical protein